MAPPRAHEFVLWVAIGGAAMVLLYVGLTPRNDALAREGFVFFKPKTSWDDHIPLWPSMVWPYYSYFALLVSAMWVEVRHRLWLYQGAAGAIGVAATGFLLFYALPSQMEQPDLRAYADPAHRALQAMYDFDKGYHVFPSMHVALSVYTANFWRERIPRYWLGPGLVAFAVCVSTVLCKRHYLLDIPAGLAVGLVMGQVGNRVGAHLAKLCTFLR